MNEIQELERKLSKAKKSKEESERRKQIQEFKDKYVGKCFGSSTFSRSSKATWKSAFKISSIDNEGMISREYITLSKYEGSLQYHYTIYTKEKLDHNYHFSKIYKKVEISNNTFEKLKQVGILYAKNLEDCFNNKFDINIEETNGDHYDIRVYKEMLDSVGTEYIDMDDHKLLLSKLWKTDFPTLIHNRFLLRDKKDEICDKLIGSLSQSASIWGGKVAERDYSHIKVIEQIKAL